MEIGKLEKIRKNNLDELAYKKLKELILTGVLKPGDQIIQSQLAEVLGISRTPLRDALTQLEKEYLIKTENGKAYVRELSKEELIIVFEIRAVLEGLIGRYFAKNPDIEWLTEVESKYKEAFKSGDVQEYRKVDIEFHSGLAERVGIPILREVTNNFWILSICLSKGLLRKPEETIDEHIKIINALKERNTRESERLLVEHISSTVKKLREEEGEV